MDTGSHTALQPRYALSLVSDETLHGVLLKVGLWSHLSTGEYGTSGRPLSEKLASLPALSVGQFQLLAMARAIVQKYSLHSGGVLSDGGLGLRSKLILLLDEATSSLDSETESTIYKLVESEFVSDGHTVIIVAHRLNALGDSIRPDKDVVVVVERGCIKKVELGSEGVKSLTET